MAKTGGKKVQRSKEALELLERAKRELQQRPLISDSDFLKETEVDAAAYEHGFSAVLPAVEASKSLSERAEEGFCYDPDPANSTILFQMWKDKGIAPDVLKEGYEDMEPHYIQWLKERGYL